ncbi:MAG: DMT family transporter [Paracoccaceae bacterium]
MTLRQAGILLVLASAVPFALSGVFTRIIPAGLWNVLAWRGLVGGAVILVYALWREGGGPMGWRGWLIAIVGAAASLAFLAAFRMTYVANVALIYATAPFAAAGLDWLIRGQAAPASILRAAAVSLVGVAVIVAGGLGAGRLPGDLMALCMVGLFALYTVMIRAFDKAPAMRAGAFSALLLFVAGCILGQPFSVPFAALPGLAGFGCSFALAVVLFTEGARRIAAAEAGFYGGAEVPFAVIFAWLILGETPPWATIVGGTIVVSVVAWRGVSDLRGLPLRLSSSGR